MLKRKMIIGLTGTLGAGKGKIAEILVNRGFKHYSVRGFINEEIVNRRLEISRDNMVRVANDLRAMHGPSFIIEKVYEKAKDYGGNCIIESIRNQGEVDALKRKGDFILVAIDANPKVRYQRNSIRGTETDSVSFEKFIEEEQREMFNLDSNKQNLSKCISMADFKITNNGSIQDLEKDVNEILRRIGFAEETPNKTKKRQKYISWDDYFMGVSILSGKRSKDPNTQVGACIVNGERRIVGIGYNGFPQGCDDEYFPWSREGTFLETKYPYVVHAELNAILNSMGKDLKGSTLYVAMFPCNECAKAIIQTGIKRLVFLLDKYAHTDGEKAARKMFDAAGVKYEQLVPKDKEILLNFEGN